jgi:hypothetical protein
MVEIWTPRLVRYSMVASSRFGRIGLESQGVKNERGVSHSEEPRTRTQGRGLGRVTAGDDAIALSIAFRVVILFVKVFIRLRV